MKTTISKIVTALAVGLISYQPVQVSAQKKSVNNQNWENLFDAKSLKGWKRLGGNAPYTIEGDAIVGTMTKGTPNSFLVTEKEYGDFILEVDIKLEGTETNSGVQTRSHYDTEKKRVFGRQVEVDPTKEPGQVEFMMKREGCGCIRWILTKTQKPLTELMSLIVFVSKP